LDRIYRQLEFELERKVQMLTPKYLLCVSCALMLVACGKTNHSAASVSSASAANMASKPTIQVIEDQRQQLEKAKQVAKDAEAAAAAQKQALDAVAEGK
jgi:ABC-type enterochelin transport system substrate-binding protein